MSSLNWEEGSLLPAQTLRQHLSGVVVPTATALAASVSDATDYTWRKKIGGVGLPDLADAKALEKENARLKSIEAGLELDKLILNETLDTTL
ncbi:MAG: hypothetical protein AAF216_03710 [Pseudomonadota bacterium]